jgi:hypothetical protein
MSIVLRTGSSSNIAFIPCCVSRMRKFILHGKEDKWVRSWKFVDEGAQD